MFARDLADGSVLMIEQEDHTDLSAQFAAHWGNAEFSRPEPYQSVVFGTIYHDSGHREMEADLPIDVEKGLPYAFRGVPPALRRREADAANVKWIESRDPYASLVVQMHHNGLRKGRYNTVRARYPDRQAASDTADGGFESALADLESGQKELVEQLGLNASAQAAGLWHNYQALQVF